MDFQSRLLREGPTLETMGLFAYVRQLVDRRWVDPTLRGYVYAVSPVLDRSPELMHSCDILSIGNSAYICTVIMIDPGHPTLLAIMNRDYSFVHHCLTGRFSGETASLTKISSKIPPGVAVALIAQCDDNITIIAAAHNQLLCPCQILCAINIPPHVCPIIRGICKTYAAQVMTEFEEDGLLNLIIMTTPTPITRKINNTDFCPLSSNARAINNFDPYCPNMWSRVPLRRSAEQQIERPLSAPSCTPQHMAQSWTWGLVRDRSPLFSPPPTPLASPTELASASSGSEGEGR